MAVEPIPTVHFDNLKAYHARATRLQELNLASPHGRVPEPGQCDDPLQTYVKIYDVVERRYAGFSNALEQVWYGSEAPKAWQRRPEFDGLREQLSLAEWLFVFLLHRVTGSGASFAADHGFRNSLVADLCLELKAGNGDLATAWVGDQIRSPRPCFTSIGNQIPAFPKPKTPYQTGGELYFSVYAMPLCMKLAEWLQEPLLDHMTIREVVDWVLAWHVDHGLKRWVFVLTAFAMDIAEYFPGLVNPWSHANYGKNALEAMDLLFERPDGLCKDAFYDRVMERCCLELGEVSQPMSMEDVLCDYIRYVERYVPKGYEDLELWQVTPNFVGVNHHEVEPHASYRAKLEAVQAQGCTIQQRIRWLDFVNLSRAVVGSV